MTSNTNNLPPEIHVYYRKDKNGFQVKWKIPNSSERFHVGHYTDRAAALEGAKAFYDRVRHIATDDEVDAFVGDSTNYCGALFNHKTYGGKPRTVAHGSASWIQPRAKHQSNVFLRGKKKFVGYFSTLAECNEANKAMLEKHCGANEAYQREKREAARDKFVARMAKARWERATKRAKRSREAEWSDPWELPEAKRAARWNAQICHAEASLPLRTVLLPYYVSATSA